MPKKILACAGFETFGHQRRPTLKTEKEKCLTGTNIYIFFAFLGFLCFEHKPSILNNHADGLSQSLPF